MSSKWDVASVCPGVRRTSAFQTSQLVVADHVGFRHDATRHLTPLARDGAELPTQLQLGCIHMMHT